jgi:predicted CoA-substrate-specific enzyme activase
MTDSYFVGVDVGASATKVAVIDADGALCGKTVIPSGFDFYAAGEAALDTAFADAGISSDQATFVLATGYGRSNVPSATATKTEISCHARGAYHVFKKRMTLIDIGGQDNKVIEIDEHGKRLDFKMNRKCAAGTGAFIEEIARRINLPMDALDGLARKSTKNVEIGSFCTVFSATEILALIRQGTDVQDIVRGVFWSVAKRIGEMAPLSDNIVVTGGVVAYNPIVIELLGQLSGARVVAPPYPQLCGAIGAALYAKDASEQDRN